ncbi:hypothetical protein J3Q64DRAFT_1681506 [Phycomyces blakesleeanus]|uniref:Histone chaperone RTT106/FACT complex subunit SPT16-like middle domain-containing protein n=1 Tax=Phycomyces blakesleeanus TaxID=4837 RepID=A0ABR3AR75_PHYBL
MTAWLEESIDEPGLRQALQDVLTKYPSTINTIKGLIDHYTAKLALVEQAEPDSKKRKTNHHNTLEITAPPTHTIIASIIDVSFNIPARKKFNIVITNFNLQLVNSKTQIPEYEYLLDDVEIASCTPTPDKAQKNYTIALFFKNKAHQKEEGENTPAAITATESVVFNIQDKADLVVTRPGHQTDQILGQDKHLALIEILQKDARLSVTQPSGQLLYVNVFLRSKQGSLFFLPEGVLYGFKKPTFIIPVKSISSIVVSTITQHTFDLSLILKKGANVSGVKNKDEKEQTTTIEFSMIERSEYDGIDEYIKRSKIHDKSMSEETKAPEPKQKANNNKTISSNNYDDDDDDEEDEDYDPSNYEKDLNYGSDSRSEGDSDDFSEDDDIEDEIEDQDQAQDQDQDGNNSGDQLEDSD